MIELSHFDLSSIITKLNQGVEETSAGHGSDFEKVLSEHLELSGIKSGKPYPLLNTPEEKIDQNGVSDDPGRLDIENRSDLSSLTHSKFADQSYPDNEHLRGLSKTPISGRLIELEENVPSNKLGETLAALPVIEPAPEVDSSQSPISISFELRPIDYFFDIESAERDRLAKLTISQSEALRSGFENQRSESSRTREISDTTGQFLGFEDLLRQTENSSSTNNHGPSGDEFSLPQKPKTAFEHDPILGHVNVMPVTAELSSIVTEEPKAVVDVDSNGAKASEAILVPLSTLRRRGASINKLSLSSAVTPGIFERNQRIDKAVRAYPDSESAVTNASVTFLPRIIKTEGGAGDNRLYLEGARTKPIPRNEGIVESPKSGSLDAPITGIQRKEKGSERNVDGRIYEQVRTLEQRPQVRNPHDGPYIETLSGQRQVLVGGRQSGPALADISSEIEVAGQGAIQSDRTNDRKEVRSQSSLIDSTITNQSDMQLKRGRNKAFGYTNDVNSRIRPSFDESSVSRPGVREARRDGQPKPVESIIDSMITNQSDMQLKRGRNKAFGYTNDVNSRIRPSFDESSVSRPGVREARRDGQPKPVESMPARKSILKDIPKALELESDAVLIKSDASKLTTSGKINGLFGGMESTSSRDSAPMNLQPAETMSAAMVVNEEQPTESMVKRLGPSSFQAELDLSGYDTRRGLLREELDRRVDQLIRRVGSQIRSGQLNELHIKLHPRELGVVSFSVELLDGNDIGVKIVSASDEASKLLKEHWPSHWQDGGLKVSSQETGDRGLSGNSSNPHPEEKPDQKRENTSKDVADSSRRLVERDPSQDLAENDHNIDITV